MKFVISSSLEISNPKIEELKSEIEESITNCNEKFRRGNIPIIRSALHKNLMRKGWSDEVYVDSSSKISITSIKSCVGLCIQTGNVGRMYADLLKLQTLHLHNSIVAAFYVLPTRDAAHAMGDNIVHFERLIRELIIFKNVINIPIITYGFYNQRSEK